MAADPNLNPPHCRGTDNKLMRSTKSRSRNKSNRQRSLGNIVNRVFDSSGPEGKVRGTPQQIIEKYLTLARDAQLSNDRVAEQSFFQHAEHYTRMLGEAQREQAERQQQQQQQRNDDDSREDGDAGGNHRGGGRNGHAQQRDRSDAQQPASGEEPRSDNGDAPAAADGTADAASQPRNRARSAARTDREDGLPVAISSAEDAPAGPVETPEDSLAANQDASDEAPRPAPRRRVTRSPAAPRTRKKAADADSGPSKEPASEG